MLLNGEYIDIFHLMLDISIVLIKYWPWRKVVQENETSPFLKISSSWCRVLPILLTLKSTLLQAFYFVLCSWYDYRLIYWDDLMVNWYLPTWVMQKNPRNVSKVQEVFYKVNAAVISTQWVFLWTGNGWLFWWHFIVINYSSSINCFTRRRLLDLHSMLIWETYGKLNNVKKLLSVCYYLEDEKA